MKFASERFGTGLTFCLLFATAARAQPPPANVVVAKAAIRPLPNTMTLVATVEPLTRSVVASEIAGIVEAMPVRQGDRVDAGALIVRLNADSLRWQLAEAEAALGGTKARLTRWEFEVERIRKLYGKDQANEREVYDTKAEHDSAQFDFEAQTARVAKLRTDLAKTEIRAPFSGYVVTRETEVGEWVERGGAVVEMVDLSSVLVRVDVPESAIPFVKEGTSCQVTIEAVGRTYEGKVRHIMRQADADAHTFPVEIIVENEARSLAGGMFARATIVSGRKADVVAVPKDAVVERDGVRYVALVIPGEHGMMGMLSPITTGADVGEWIAVTSGNLQAGMAVIVRGNERMFPFPSPVRIVDERGKPVSVQADSPGTQDAHGVPGAPHGSPAQADGAGDVSSPTHGATRSSRRNR